MVLTRIWLSVLASLAAWTSAAAGDVHFVDVTAAAGLDRLHFDGVSPPGLSNSERDMLFMSAGAAAADYDGDGWPDLYVTRLGAPNLLYRNRRDGTFAEVGSASGVALDDWSTACTWADVDGDRDLDLYVLSTAPATRAYLFINDGNGHFTEEAEARGLALDVPGAVTTRMSGAAFGDYDRDGDLDVYVTEWHISNDRVRLFANDGGGHFRDVTAEAGLVVSDSLWGWAPRFADMDADGWPDLLVVGDFGTSRLYRNERDGTFSDLTLIAGVGSDENGMGSAIGDVDGDGRLDWFVTSIFDPLGDAGPGGWGTTGNRLYGNLGNNAFMDTTDRAGVRDGAWGWGAVFFDHDNDGDLDLTMTNGVRWSWTPFEDPFNDDGLRLWENDGTGDMREVAGRRGLDDTGSGKALVVLDFDRDGDQDLFVANCGDFPVLYENVGGNKRSWLQLELRGARSSACACGARVTVQVVDGGPVQVREASLGGGFMGQDEPLLHFGLGADVTTVHEVRVRWPLDRRETVRKHVSVNRRLVLHEGGGGALRR